MSHAIPLGYKPQLDGLRAIAVGAVMVHHFLPMDRLPAYEFINLGMLGVLLFFVLSGFLITGILLKCRDVGELNKADARFAMRQFYARRFLRIFPVYYVTLFVLAGLNLWTVRETLFWHLGYLSNVYFALRGDFYGPLSHFWTLAVEEQFYLIWPWVVVLSPRKYLRRIILLTIVAAPVFRLSSYFLMGHGFSANILLFGCLDSLALGALLAYSESQKQIQTTQQELLRHGLWIGLTMILILSVLNALGVSKGALVPLLVLAISMVFMRVVQRAAHGFKGPLGGVLEFAPVVYVGRISYGIYLFHNLMPFILPGVLRRIGLTYPVGPGATIPRVGLLVVATVALASASWHLLEKPINGLKSSFQYSKRKPAEVWMKESAAAL